MLVLDKICKSHAKRLVLNSLSLEVHEGEFFVLIGPSGSGKSTILKLISGIDNVDSGSILIDQSDVTTKPAYRRPVHTVFQQYALFPHLNVLQNIIFPLRMSGLNGNSCTMLALESLEWVEMNGFENRSIKTLSGGEKQRVALARALVNKPKLLLLDEPLSALDPNLRGNTLELLQRLQSQLHLTYIYVTHDREEAMKASSRLAVLKDGTIQQIGTASEIYNHPASRFVSNYLGSMNWLPATVCSTQPELIVQLPDGLSLKPIRPDSILFIGQKVHIGIRPESISFSDNGLISGTVVAKTFLGVITSFLIKTNYDSLLSVDTFGNNHSHEIDDLVKLCWSDSKSFCYGVD